jgi:DNA-binding NtrC family response regulator
MASLLLIEDTPAVLRVLHRGLTEAGHSVDTASDVETGLRRCVLGRYDLVITDLCPREVESVGWLRQLDAVRPAIPVVIVTGRDCQEVRQVLEAAGAPGVASVLQKPFSVRELTAMVQRALAAGSRGTQSTG